jgi:hypothetical protein
MGEAGPTGTRHIGSPPRPEAQARGAMGAERSELALTGAAGCVAAFSGGLVEIHFAAGS